MSLKGALRSFNADSMDGFRQRAAKGQDQMAIDRRDLFRGGLLLSATALATGGTIGTSAAQQSAPLPTLGERSAPSAKDLNSRLVYRRAVDAVIWRLPLVGEDAVKQAAFRDGKATYNDIVWWPKGGGWKNQSPTPNVNTRYIYFFINTQKDGPVVVELPPAVPGASFYGTIEDAWYVPLVDMGFEGKGGKYLVLPPDFKGDVPDGYIVVRPETYNSMTLVRSILDSLTEEAVRAGDALVKQIKVYPLSQAADPPAQRFLDMSDVLYDGLVKYDETFFTSLARMLDEETVQPRDLQMMGMLLPLGIEKGEPFHPDAATAAELKAAAEEAHAWLMAKAATDVTPWWPDSQWSIPTPPITVPSHMKWETISLGSTRAPSLCRNISARRPSSAPAASTSGPFMTMPASRSKAAVATVFTFRPMCRCASSGLSQSTVLRHRVSSSIQPASPWVRWTRN
jgi:hypothetical protein